MAKLEYFDGNCTIGMPGVPSGKWFDSTAELLEEMDYFGISEAVVNHQTALSGCAVLGNRLLMDLVGGHPNLHPAWVVLPSHTGEMPAERDLVKQMLDEGVKLARVLPGKNWIEFKDWALGRLFEALEGQPIPLVVDVDEVSWDDIHQVCTRHSELNVIVTGHCGRPRNAFAVVRACPNVHLDLTGFYNGHLVEQLCENCGAKQLVFGSRMPERTPGCLMNMLARAEICDEDKRMIAGGNLQRLIGGHTGE